MVTHYTESKIDKDHEDWIIHYCLDCDFELWDNMKTGDTRIFNCKKDVNHTGSVVHEHLIEPFINRN